MLQTRLCAVLIVACLTNSPLLAQNPPPPRSAEEFATLLIQTTTDEGRLALLHAHRELVAPRLRKLLVARAFRATLGEDFEQALAAIRVMELVAERDTSKAWLAVAMIGKASIFFLQGKLLNARAAYARVPKVEEFITEKDAAAYVLQMRGFIGYFLRGYEQGLKDCFESLKLRDAEEDKADIGFTLNAIAMIFTEQRRFAEAEEHLNRSTKILAEVKDPVWRALPLNTFGMLYAAMDRHEEALRYYEQSLTLIRQFNVNVLLNYALHGMGECYLELGEHTKALDYFRQSLALRERGSDRVATARTLKNLAVIHRELGDYAEALRYCQQSLQLFEEANRKDLAAARLSDIGQIYYDQNNLPLALEYYERGAQLAREVNDHESLWKSHSSTGWIHITARDYDRALASFQKALVASEAFGEKAMIITALNTVALAHARLGEGEKAQQHLQRAIALSRETQSQSLVAETMYYAGHTYMLRKDYNRAVEYFQQGLNAAAGASARRQAKYLLVSLANAHQAKGEYQKSLDYAERAADAARGQGDSLMFAEARTILGRAHRALGRADSARRAFDESISAVETRRSQVVGGEQGQQRFFETQVTPYHEVVALLLSQGRTGEALAYAERAKARVLLDVLQNGRLDIARAMTDDERVKERKLNGEISALNSQLLREMQGTKSDPARLDSVRERLRKARLNQEDFQARLYAAHPQLKVQRGDATPLKPEEASALLSDAQTALLEYVVTDDRTYLFTVARGEAKGQAEVKSFALPIARAELAEKVARFRRQLAERDFDFTATAKELYAALIKPALAEVKDKARLVIVPDGALWEMPFQALMAEDNHYLIQDAALSYAPSLTFLREVKRQQRGVTDNANAPLLAVGNPLLHGRRLPAARRDEKLSPLPESEREVKSLAQLYGAERSKILVGAQALEGRIKAEANQYAVLHFATHGLLNDSSPLYSSIVLSPAETEKEDGLLEAREVMTMDLKARLVVLSACETGRGRVGAGEGLIGFSWAFFVAGCPTTVVSQWKVDSASTSELMLEFHKYLKGHPISLKPGLTTAEALRQASLVLMRTNDYSHPFYWAGFVVVGDGF